MTNILSIATAVPDHAHPQAKILDYMVKAYGLADVEARKLRFLYRHSGIDTRHSVLPDFDLDKNQTALLAPTGNDAVSLEKRMAVFQPIALDLSVKALNKCLSGHLAPKALTHLITVSCTGMRAPGLDLELVEALGLSKQIVRSSVNFMGCYAAVHALKWAHYICQSAAPAHVAIVCTELCTLHFQHEATEDNMASSLLFADGSAAILLSNVLPSPSGHHLSGFYADLVFQGKQDMAWDMGSHGFLMRLGGEVPLHIAHHLEALLTAAFQHYGLQQTDVDQWCIHPGGKRILDLIEKQLGLAP
ncbi:MAG: type III polyketide synthase, partial [Sphingobacteriia bacterium]